MIPWENIKLEESQSEPWQVIVLQTVKIKPKNETSEPVINDHLTPPPHHNPNNTLVS